MADVAANTTAPTTVKAGPNKLFKEKYTFEERINEARKKKESNPRLLPLIVEKHSRSKLPEMEKSK